MSYFSFENSIAFQTGFSKELVILQSFDGDIPKVRKTRRAYTFNLSNSYSYYFLIRIYV